MSIFSGVALPLERNVRFLVEAYRVFEIPLELLKPLNLLWKKMNENRRNSNKFRGRKKETGVGNTIAMELWERRKALLKCLSYSKFQRAGERGSYAFKGYEGPIYLSKSKFEMHRIIGAIFNAHVTWNKLLSTSSPKRGKLSITKTFDDHFQRKKEIVWVKLPLIPIPYPAERHNAHK